MCCLRNTGPGQQSCSGPGGGGGRGCSASPSVQAPPLPADRPSSALVLAARWVLAGLLQVQALLGQNVHGGRVLDGAAGRGRVHEHVGDLAAEVDLAVGCDGLVLHELQVLGRQLQLRRRRADV